MINYANEFPKPFSLTRFLCFPSCFLLIPAIYAYSHALYLFSFLCVLATGLSFNHWRRAENGYRRKVDKLIAWVCFVVFLFNGCYDCRGTRFYYYAVPIVLFFISSSFLFSDYLSVRLHPLWCCSHMIFHLVSALATCIVIFCAQLKKQS
jgi:hypothetical protein